MFITSTNFGEVKLWDNQCMLSLGTLNSHAFEPPRVIEYIEHSNNHLELLENATTAVKEGIVEKKTKITKINKPSSSKRSGY